MKNPGYRYQQQSPRGARQGSQKARPLLQDGRLIRQHGERGRRAVLPRIVRPSKSGGSFGRRLALIMLLSMIGLTILMSSAGVIAVAVGYNQIASMLKPRLEALKDHQPFLSSRIYDRNGTLLYEFFGEGRREPIAVDQVSENLINATIAIEDSTFYENTGVDYGGIMRAFYQNAVQKEEISGASTITQQVIKNVLLTPEERSYEKRYERKLKEIVLAQELNNIYSKEQILELYLNEIPYGNLAYGIQAASKSYFGVDASKLNLAQASLLAGLPQSPTVLNPIPHIGEEKVLPGVALGADWLDPAAPFPKAALPPKQRQIEVLRQMVNVGFITEAQGRAIAARDLEFIDQEFSLLAPHFVFFVRDYLEQRYGPKAVTDGGLRVYTTLDLELQALAQEEARRRIQELEVENRNIHNAAVVIMQPNTGQILAMVGSIGYTMTMATTTPGEEGNVLDGNVNVTTMPRQPGSALKPFNYLNGLEQNILYAQGKSEYPGITPGTVIYDVETRFPAHIDANRRNINKCEEPEAYWYCPVNYTGKWYGPMRLHMALPNSLNMPAVKVLKRSGVQNFIDLLHRTGVASTSLNRGLDVYGLALTLGGGEVTPLDMATAYNTLASGGRYFPPTPILKVTDSEGKVLEEFKPVPLPQRPNLDTDDCLPPTAEEYVQGKRLPPGTQCVDPRLAFIITKVMSDNKARTPMFGLENILNLSRSAAVKTGTTNDFRDAWASGFTPYLTVSVWTGNNNNEMTAKVESTTSGGHIWHRIMERVFTNQRLMQLLSEPFGGPPPEGWPDSFPGVEKKKVCSIGGNWSGPDEEYFVPEFRRVRVRENDGKTEVVLGGAKQLSEKCDPSPPFDPNNLVIAEKDKLPGEIGSSPTPGEEELPTPEATAKPTSPPPPPSGPAMPDLRHYGENQAKGILGNLGSFNIVVDYQGRDRIPDVFDQYAPYAVVSHSPPPGTPLSPGATIVLGIRAPE